MIVARGYITISNVQAIEGKDAVVYKLLVSKTLVTSIDDMINVKLMKTVGDKAYIFPDDILFLTNEDRQRIIYSYDGTTDYTAHSSQILNGTTFRYGDYCKSGKFLNLVLINNRNSKVLDVVTIMEARKGEDGEPGHSPYIQDDYWWLWDINQNKYVNSGTKVKGEPGKDALAYKLIPVVERAYIIGSERDSAGADVYLSYKVQKSVGENVVYVNPSDEGLDLYTSAMLYKKSDGIETYFEHNYYYNRLAATEQITVTLSRGNEVLDTRIVNLTFKPSVMFSIDHELGEVTSNIRSLDGKHNTLSQTIDGLTSEVANKVSKTEFRQTAEDLALEVVDNSKGRQNLLVGSAFRNESEVSWNNPSLPCIISRHVNYEGTNAIKIESTAATPVYKGIAFKDIALKKGQTYNLSFMSYREAANVGYAAFEVDAYMVASDNNSKAKLFRPLAESISFGEPFEWKLNSFDFTPSEDTSFVNVLFWIEKAGLMYISRPMLKEGAGYTRWTLSQFDYDYVGGNLLDGTKNLDGAHITVKKGTVEDHGEAKKITHRATKDEYFLTWHYLQGLLKPDTDYILSFLAKGNGVLLSAVYGGSNKTVFFENSDRKYKLDSYGDSDVALTSEWKRHWVRIRTSKNIVDVTVVGFRLTKAGYMASVAEVKLEEGCLDTPYTNSQKTLVDEDVFKKAGLNLKKGRFEATGDNFVIRNSKGETTLLVDDKGRVVANSVQTKNNEGFYSKMEPGIFELGLNGSPFLTAAIDGENNPVLQFRDKEGRLIGVIDRFMFNERAISDSWMVTEKIALPVSPVWIDIIHYKSHAATNYYVFTEGYIEGGSVKKYNIGYNGDRSVPSQYNGLTFVSNNVATAFISNGWYMLSRPILKDEDGFGRETIFRYENGLIVEKKVLDGYVGRNPYGDAI